VGRDNEVLFDQDDRCPFEEAISRSKTALAAHGFDIAAEIDQAATG
jgi:uncharacterized protein (DUF302 family)